MIFRKTKVATKSVFGKLKDIENRRKLDFRTEVGVYRIQISKYYLPCDFIFQLLYIL